MRAATEPSGEIPLKNAVVILALAALVLTVTACASGPKASPSAPGTTYAAPSSYGAPSTYAAPAPSTMPAPRSSAPAGAGVTGGCGGCGANGKSCN